MPVVDEPWPDEPLTRRRGRHAAPSAAPATSWIGRIAPVTARMRARTSPRAGAAAAWLLERRLHVLVIGSGVATAALIGGSVAVLQLSAPAPDEEASVVVPTSRPTSTDPASPNAFGPVLPSPSPASPVAPATQAPVGPPADEALEPGVDDGPGPEPAPEPGDAPRRETAPGATNRPEKPRD